MIDQANDLRRLVMLATDERQEAATRRSKTILVAGGKGGVGTTTIAVNLAVSMAQIGIRTVLVDADPNGADIQTLCRLQQRYTISDVLDRRRTLGEALQPGPAGVMILPGAWAVTDLVDASEHNQERLLGQFAGLANRADAILFDGGNGLYPFTRRLWQTCEELVLVTSTDTSAVLDTYAALKIALHSQQQPRIHLLVNKCTDANQATEIHGRITRSTQRFLGFGLPPWRWLPEDPNIVTAGCQGTPFTLAQTAVVATETLAALAGQFHPAGSTHFGVISETHHLAEIPTIQKISQNRLKPGEENADSEDDRSLFARC